MADACTIRIEAGEDPRPHLAEGAVLCLGPGRHPYALFIEHSLSVKGEPGAIIDAGGAGSAVHIAGDGLTVRLTGLTLTRGRAELGGGLRLDGDADVLGQDLVIEGNQASAGGAGLGQVRGRLSLKGCTLKDGAYVTTIGTLACDGTTFEGGLSLREDAQVTLGEGCVASFSDLRGVPRRAPTLVINGGDPGELRQDKQHPGTVTRLP